MKSKSDREALASRKICLFSKDLAHVLFRLILSGIG